MVFNSGFVARSSPRHLDWQLMQCPTGLSSTDRELTTNIQGFSKEPLSTCCGDIVVSDGGGTEKGNNDRSGFLDTNVGEPRANRVPIPILGMSTWRFRSFRSFDITVKDVMSTATIPVLAFLYTSLEPPTFHSHLKMFILLVCPSSLYDYDELIQIHGAIFSLTHLPLTSPSSPILGSF